MIGRLFTPFRFLSLALLLAGAQSKRAAAAFPPGGVERRSANRPWTALETAEVSEEVAAPAPQRKAAAGGGDQEGEEF